MNAKANYVRSRLSLRKPLAESLEILQDLTDILNLDKNPDLNAELVKVHDRYPICTDFERDFVSICFAIATGVGKTRLMGAFISYLYLEKGIKNFFVMAPNLTIYQKLIADFSQPTNPKYVFKGIGEFAVNPPRVVTGDTYESAGYSDLYTDVTINVFNISKLNAEARGGKEPRIKRLQECLGDSYFNHLANLDDLVLLMDESHHYRAAQGMRVINELNPILGLELTATPQIEKGQTTIKFTNVVYEYSLAKAINDGYVKEPAVATRKDFDPATYTPEELDQIKLEDGIRIHEDTKNKLDIYARDNRVDLVKPFVLVVAKETGHASKLMSLIQSQAFFDGRYADKVMEIHSNQRGTEKEENVQLLLSLEDPKNHIEIVIHVNILKEGWDVTNLYTIIPLRTAASMTLREQTIGRGLRLPYGKRTGVKGVDLLTIIAHDKFQQIVDAANDPESIIRKENIIEIDPAALAVKKEVITASSIFEEEIQEERKLIEKIEAPEEKQQATFKLDAKAAILDVLPEMGKSVRNASEILTEGYKNLMVEKVREHVKSDPQQNMFVEEIIKEAVARYEYIVKDFIARIIEIPKIMIVQNDEVKSGFKDFDLNTSPLHFQPVSEEIFRQALQSNEVDHITGTGGIAQDRLDNILVNELLNQPEIDYDEQTDLLFKLTGQVVSYYETYLKDEEIKNVVLYRKRAICDQIYSQMMEHFFVVEPKYGDAKVYPFVQIEAHNFEKLTVDRIHDFKDTISPTSAIPSKVFVGFKKACHLKYKFDSKTEKDFAGLLEGDGEVVRWMRPAKKQFTIHFDRNTRRYEPDFVAETASTIYMVETKSRRDMKNEDVVKKTEAALKYCTDATAFTTSNGGKPWKYLLIPHDAVMHNMSFNGLALNHEVRVDV